MGFRFTERVWQQDAQHSTGLVIFFLSFFTLRVHGAAHMALIPETTFRGMTRRWGAPWAGVWIAMYLHTFTVRT